MSNLKSIRKVKGILIFPYIYLIGEGGMSNGRDGVLEICHLLTHNSNTLCMFSSGQLLNVNSLFMVSANKSSSSSLDCKGDAFNVNGMDDALKKELLSSWWAWRNGNHVEFWQREYDKHGKCSDNVFPKTEYFRKTLAVYHDFDIAQTLQKANIVPQPLQPKISQRPLSPKPAAGHSVDIRCYQQNQKNSTNGSKPLIYLAQVVLCFNEYGKNRTGCDPKETTKCKLKTGDLETVPSIAHIRLWV
ncbi:unnamed protein product [Malus baccata var. baccata]